MNANINNLDDMEFCGPDEFPGEFMTDAELAESTARALASADAALAEHGSLPITVTVDRVTVDRSVSPAVVTDRSKVTVFARLQRGRATNQTRSGAPGHEWQIELPGFDIAGATFRFETEEMAKERAEQGYDCGPWHGYHAEAIRYAEKNGIVAKA